MSDIFFFNDEHSDSQSTCNYDGILRVAGRSVKDMLILVALLSREGLVTNLIVKDSISDIFHDYGHSLNIFFVFLVALGIETIVEHVSTIPD